MNEINWEGIYSIPDATIRQMVEEEIGRVTICHYYDEYGCRREIQYETVRDATEEEREMLIKIAYGAIRCARFTRDIQHCCDTAEWITDEFIENCNGYLTIYCPIKTVWRRMVEMANGEEEMK